MYRSCNSAQSDTNMPGLLKAKSINVRPISGEETQVLMTMLTSWKGKSSSAVSSKELLLFKKALENSNLS
jgi:hypothetical protein